MGTKIGWILRASPLALLFTAALGLSDAIAQPFEAMRAYRAGPDAPEIAYYAGGIGQSPERDAAEQSQEFSVKVVFAAPDRSFLANVELKVADTAGRVIFLISRSGPLLYLGLPSGRYDFLGSYHGREGRQSVAVETSTRQLVVFVFPE